VDFLPAIYQFVNKIKGEHTNNGHMKNTVFSFIFQIKIKNGSSIIQLILDSIYLMKYVILTPFNPRHPAVHSNPKNGWISKLGEKFYQ